MKHSKHVIIVFLFAIIFTACKTTEANYRKAYETAKEKQYDGGDSTVTENLKNNTLPKTIVIQGVALPIRTEAIGITKDEGASKETLRVYNVVTASFKQLFNARSMRNRLSELGFQSFILHNRDLTYYVVAGTAATPQEALDLLNRVKAENSVVTRAPFPYVLRAAHLVRK